MTHLQKYLLVCVMLFVMQGIIAQEATYKKGSQEFASKNFPEAITIFEKQSDRTQELLEKLADSYYYTQNYAKASTTYKELFDKFNPDAAFKLRYANAAKSLEEYELANELLSDYTGEEVDILTSIQADMGESPMRYFIETLSTSSNYSEFGAVEYDGKLVFASSRNTDRPIYEWNQQPFLDLFQGEVQNGMITNIKPFFSEVNTDLHESNPTFSADGKTMYFTRNSKNKTRVNGARVSLLQIFKAEFKDGKWTNIEPVSFNGKNYSVAHPSLSADGKKLYFSSDMSGGYGSYDIYEVAVNADGSFGKPKNLGENINSEGLDQFPFISQKGNLYFSSDRINSLGGLDLYFSTGAGNGFATAKNMGADINTSRDDFALAIDEANWSGYFSSNRSGKDKIYAFNEASYFITGTIKDDETGQPIADAKVIVRDAQNDIVEIVYTNEAGEYQVSLPQGSYNVKVTKNRYETIEKQVTFNNSNEKRISLDLAIAKTDKTEESEAAATEYEPIYFYFDTDFIRRDMRPKVERLLDILKSNLDVNILITGYTDIRGPEIYNHDLARRRAESVRDYFVRNGVNPVRLEVREEGEGHPAVECEARQCTEADHRMNRRTEFDIRDN